MLRPLSPRPSRPSPVANMRPGPLLRPKAAQCPGVGWSLIRSTNREDGVDCRTSFGIKWVFFDIGSTLIDEDDAVEDRLLKLQAVLKHSGVSVSREEIGMLLQEAITKQVR